MELLSGPAYQDLVDHRIPIILWATSTVME